MPNSEEVAVSTRIVVAVANAKGVDPLSLSPPLADEIDVDALDQLCDSADDLDVSFTAWGYRVTVSNERVTAESTTANRSIPAD